MRPLPNIAKRTAARRRQKGVAIITALLIVAIAATISITISTRLQLDVRRTANLVASDQAWFYLLAAEEWSQRILRDDKKESSIDDLSEAWAFELPPLPVEGGTIQGRLTDLQACINVNTLINENGINLVTEKRLQQLFRSLGLNPGLTQAITDWIDTDLETTNPNGAEDGYYLNLPQPYHTANTAMQSITELRLVKGFEDPKVYLAVAPYLCAFDTGGNEISINVNTASAEVLQSLSEKMTENLAKDIIERRQDEPFNDIKDFTGFSGLKDIIKDTKQLSTSSDYFLLRTQAVIGQANRVMYSIIYRDDSGKTSIIARSQRTL